MKGSNRIYHHPYIPLDHPQDHFRPYICRLAPDANGFSLEWIRRNDSAHLLHVGRRGEGFDRTLPLSGSTAYVNGLDTETDYACYIEDEKGQKSNVRLVRTGEIPEGAVVVNYLHPEDEQYAFSGRYLCSPSLARLPDGTLVAGMDLFAPSKAQNLTLLFSSQDNGKSWKYLNDLYPFYWGSLFTHRNALYMLGLTTEYGNLQISRSLDGGRTWTAPVVLFYGSNNQCPNGGMHRAPMHVYPYRGRLYTSCEYGSWGRGGHWPGVISIDENDDLLVPENWSCTGFLPFDGKWKEESSGKQGDTMEGNLIVGPDGKLYNILRYKMGEYLKMEVDREDPNAPLQYRGIFPAPVSNSMFRLLHYQGKYVLVTNRKTEKAGRYPCGPGGYRNVLSVFVTEDFESFRLVKDIFNFEEEEALKVGFQYPVVLVEEDGLLLGVRSAFNQANDFHNANYMLFCKVTDAEIKKAF